MRYIGIDPALTATGMVVVDASAGTGLDVIESRTIKTTKKKELDERLYDVHCGVHAFALDQRAHMHAIIEDTTDFTIRGGHARRSAHSLMVTGAAFGAAVTGLHAADIEVVAYGTKVWYPWARNRRNLKHSMKKEHALEWLRSKWPALRELNEHETMAAGVVLYHVLQW